MSSEHSSVPARDSYGRFVGQVALVTGGSHGIGFAIALELLREGAKVVVSALPADEAEGKAAFGAAGLIPDFVWLDLCSEDACRALVAATLSLHGRINLLVNNAFSFLSKGEELTRSLM